MTAKPVPPPLPPVPFAKADARSGRRWFSLHATVLALALSAILQANLEIALRWKDLFTSFHLRLPALTQLWFDVADWWYFRLGWVAAWSMAIILPIITMPLRRPRPGNEKVRWLLCANIFLVALTALPLFTYYAANVPMAMLIEGISNSGKCTPVDGDRPSLRQFTDGNHSHRVAAAAVAAKAGGGPALAGPLGPRRAGLRRTGGRQGHRSGRHL